MGSVFDPPPGQLKADGQMHPTGMGAPTSAPPLQTAMPAPGGGQPAPASTAQAAGPIQALMQALISAFAPSSIKNRGKQLDAQEQQAQGLGNEF